MIDIFVEEISKRIVENHGTYQPSNRCSENFSDKGASRNARNFSAKKFSHLDDDTDAIASQLGVARTLRQARKSKTATQRLEYVLQSREGSKELVLYFELVSVVSVGSTACEQSFSSLQGMKVHLRSTMGQNPTSTLALQ